MLVVSCDAAITIVQLIHRRAAYWTQSNDYEFSRYTSANFGLRTALRGREIKADDFSLTEQYEFWVYVGLTLRLPSGNDDGTWLAL